VINVAVKTCKKNCTLDNKEKFMSEAGRCPWGDTISDDTHDLFILWLPYTQIMLIDNSN